MHRFAASVVALTLCACAGEGLDPIVENVDSDESAIINGTPDTTRQAVVAIFGAGNSACTGTIIHVNPQTGIGHAITAAHCGTSQYVIMGNDYNNPTAVFNVVASQNHPSYNGQIYDFKMVRFNGASASTPVIAAMTPADGLTSGTQVRHVGYGKSGPAPGSNNSIRRQILGVVSGVQTATFDYNQPNGGPCSGDSGGPQLTTSGTERVVGVTSNGDQNCASYGQSGRVAAVYDSFINPYINNAPIGPIDCDGCSAAATSGQGACMTAVNACLNDAACNALVQCFNNCTTNSCYQQCQQNNPGGVSKYIAIGDCICDSACTMECSGEPLCTGGTTSSAATGSGATSSAASGTGGSTGVETGSASGVGGATVGGSDDNWNAPGNDEQKYDGTLVSSSGCAVSIRTPSIRTPAREDRPGGSWWLLALALGLGAHRRRRGDR
jgi:MYXO-CTERM domain-containing protein